MKMYFKNTDYDSRLKSKYPYVRKNSIAVSAFTFPHMIDVFFITA